MNRAVVFLLVLIAGFVLPPALRAGPVHAESGDAGSTIGTAQVVDGDAPPGSPVTTITGAISVGGGDADLYRIFISNPAAFSATTAVSPGTLGDPQLFLFRANGTGVYTNDDPSSVLQATLPAGDPNSPTTPGFYILAITGFNNDPRDAANALIFPSTFPGTFGPLTGNPLNNFSGGGQTGTYTITLTGVTHTPEPASLALFGLALVAGGAYARFGRKRPA